MNELSTHPCLVRGCPGLSVSRSQWGYCAVHYTLASDLRTRFRVSQGGESLLKEFVVALANGQYPEEEAA